MTNTSLHLYLLFSSKENRTLDSKTLKSMPNAYHHISHIPMH